MRISELKLNEANPRYIKDEKFRKLVQPLLCCHLEGALPVCKRGTFLTIKLNDYGRFGL